MAAGLAGGIGEVRAAPTAVPPGAGELPIYSGARIGRIAFPLGGLGAGTVCIEGTGALSHVSIRNRPDLFKEPMIFAALSVKGRKPVARVLEGPVPRWKLFSRPRAGQGLGAYTYGLPRCVDVAFRARFPFATVSLADDDMPVSVELIGWSPFVPNDDEASGLPVAALEYQFTNRSTAPVDAVFSFNARNFMAERSQGAKALSVRRAPMGFILQDSGTPEFTWDEAAFAVETDAADVKVNCAWFRGEWFDPQTMAWNDVDAATMVDRPPPTEGDPSPGATLFAPVSLAPGGSRTITVRLSWYAPYSDLRAGTAGEVGWDDKDRSVGSYEPWYAARFKRIDDVAAYWRDHYQSLRQRTERFTDAFYDMTLDQTVVEAVAANLCILKSPTILRQKDGRLWGWEGCDDERGAGEGSCTHVWNYAQAIPHLFPALERTLRSVEFGENQAPDGHQQYRANMPIRTPNGRSNPAADGQLGGIMKVYRDWRISGDTAWLRAIWPKVRQSLDYCIRTFDPQRRGAPEEPQHNTYDIPFWGPNGMITSFYLGALKAGAAMGRALGESVSEYERLFRLGRRRMETELFNGEYFVQKTRWTGLQADPANVGQNYGGLSREAMALMRKEGPKYQYGAGCLSDGVLGAWLAETCGVGEVLDRRMVESHLAAVYRHNLRRDLTDHANPQRPGYAAGEDGGLLLCSWPKGGKPALPFVYSDEVWTGIEYQVASHLIMTGRVEEGLAVVRTCRSRYDGRTRNPFDEYEWGHWYARAMSSYALLQALSGARYDAVDRLLYLRPAIQGDFRAFLCTASGYGTVGVKGGKPFLEVASGAIPYREIRYTAAR